MNDISYVKTCLERYFDAIDSQKSDKPIELKPALMALEEVSRNIQPEWPGRLKHYLESRSYRKAYTELGGKRD